MPERGGVVKWMLVALLLAGCGKSGDKTPEGMTDEKILGIGKYKVGVTTLREAGQAGECVPSGERNFMCLMPKAMTFGEDPANNFKGHNARSQLYFRESDPNTKLYEYQADITMCDGARLESMFVSLLGDPAGEKTTDHRRMYWRHEKALVRVIFRDSDCIVSFIDAKDQERVQEILAPFKQPASE